MLTIGAEAAMVAEARQEVLYLSAALLMMAPMVAGALSAVVASAVSTRHLAIF